MSKIAALISGNSGLVAGAGALVVAGAGAGVYLGVLQPKDAGPSALVEVAQPADTPLISAEKIAQDLQVVADVPDKAEVAVQPVAPDITEPVITEPVVEAAIAPTPPRIDEVRSEADGLTVIAGRAEPGIEAVLLVDGIENMRFPVGLDGAFAAIAFITPNGEARVLSVVQTVGDVQLAADDIILAPRAVVVASVEPEVSIKAEPEVSVTIEPEVSATVEPEVVVAVEPEVIAEPVAEVLPKVAPSVDVAQTVETTDETAQAVVASLDVVEPAPAAASEVTPTQIAPDPMIVAPSQSDEPAAVEPVAEVQAEPVQVSAITPEVLPEPAVSAPVEAEIVEPVAILKADAAGVEVINRSSAPEVMANVAIDTISYSQVGEVLLSGRAQAEARAVRVYLNNDAVATLKVDTSGRWRGDLPDVDTGIYTLRVDEVDAVGVVTSRVETPFKREAPEVLAAAQTEVDKPVKAITVQTGATLWAIARERYGEGTLYVRVLEANRDTIRNADLIYPGQVFALPD